MIREIVGAASSMSGVSQPTIRVEGLSKRYRIGLRDKQPETMREAVVALAGAPFAYLRRMLRPPTDEETLWALRDVSFDVKQGEVVGIVGHNGAGKSTLLKILTRITEPTEGRAVLRGRVGSLLEVGTGFHPELTGRENVFLNGAILGMKKWEIKAKFDEIVEFAGVDKFIDTPVKRYSSGMTVRLAFAVAAHLEPEILIIDEVLAVGDAAFQRKSLGRMENLANSGRTVIFVSNSMASIQALCQRDILLNKRKIDEVGTPNEITEYYQRSGETEKTAGLLDLTVHPNRITDPEEPIFRRLRLLNRHGETATSFPMGETITFELELDLGPLELKDPLINIAIHKHGTRICFLPTLYMINERYSLRGRMVARCHWHTGWLAPGSYSIGVLAIKKHIGGNRLDQIANVLSFDISARDVYGTGEMTHDSAIIIPDGRWEFEQNLLQPALGP